MHTQFLLTVLCSTLAVAFPFSPSKLFSSGTSTARPVQVRDLPAVCTPEYYEVGAFEYAEATYLKTNKSGSRFTVTGYAKMPKLHQLASPTVVCQTSGDSDVFAATGVESCNSAEGNDGETASGQAIIGREGGIVFFQAGKNPNEGYVYLVHSWSCQGKYFMAYRTVQVPTTCTTSTVTDMYTLTVCHGPNEKLHLPPENIQQICEDLKNC